jgi:Oxidoreductase molybdopterin binding domain
MNPSILERKERWAKKMAGQGPRVLERSNERLPPGQHLTNGFPVLDLGIRADIPLSQWSLELKGEVEEPIKLSWDDFSRLPRFEDVSDFHCVSSVEIKPAMNGRNDPASAFCVRHFEKRGIFFQTSPIAKSYIGFVWKRNADVRRLWWLGHFDHCWPV